MGKRSRTNAAIASFRNIEIPVWFFSQSIGIKQKALLSALKSDGVAVRTIRRREYDGPFINPSSTPNTPYNLVRCHEAICVMKKLYGKKISASISRTLSKYKKPSAKLIDKESHIQQEAFLSIACTIDRYRLGVTGKEDACREINQVFRLLNIHDDDAKLAMKKLLR